MKIIMLAALLCGLLFWGMGFNNTNEVTLGVGSFFVAIFGFIAFFMMIVEKKYFPATLIIIFTSILFLDALVKWS